MFLMARSFEVTAAPNFHPHDFKELRLDGHKRSELQIRLRNQTYHIFTTHRGHGPFRGPNRPSA